MSAKKTLTAAVAALTTSQSQAGSLGMFIAAIVVGTALASRSAPADQPYYGYRPVHAYEGGYGNYGGCGFQVSPIFNKYGNRIGARGVPAFLSRHNDSAGRLVPARGHGGDLSSAGKHACQSDPLA